ncbi:MAG TPA: hypothetical protein V6D17_06050 [Candidatus Obscuribacterales bacterium]
MANLERRSSMTLDEVSYYWRRLREANDRPGLHKVCDSIRTLDIAFEGCASYLSHHLSSDAWSKLRDDYFDILISSFPGYFLIYSEGSNTPLDAGAPWTESGIIEFYPERANRKSDVYRGEIRRTHPAIALSLRWCLAEGRNNTRPEDFETFAAHNKACDNPEEEKAARDLIDRLFETLEDEALKSKKIAHRKWWHLFWEANACADKRQKNELRRQMCDLQTVWGAPPR